MIRKPWEYAILQLAKIVVQRVLAFALALIIALPLASHVESDMGQQPAAAMACCGDFCSNCPSKQASMLCCAVFPLAAAHNLPTAVPSQIESVQSPAARSVAPPIQSFSGRLNDGFEASAWLSPPLRDVLCSRQI